MEDSKVCPICGCKDIGKGKQGGQGGMMSVNNIFIGSVIIADICTQCGYILSMRVEKPERFKTKK